jgi:hypothetical protein
MDTERDMVLLISGRIQRYIIFYGYIWTLSDKDLLSTLLGREDKRELYIFSYGTQTPPCKAQASLYEYIFMYVEKIYKLILVYYQWEI